MDYEFLLERMINEQIIARGVSDRRVLGALRQIKRHLFVAEDMRDYAYEDSPLPTAGGQTISQPYMVAYMTEQLELKRGAKVLEIGTGSGYQAAVLSCLAGEVYTIELNAGLSVRAGKTIESLGITNVFFKTGDGTVGWPEQAPFDRMMLTGAIPEVPKALEEQLNKNDGIIIAPAGGMPVQTIVKVTYKKGKRKEEELIECMFVPLRGKYGFL